MIKNGLLLLTWMLAFSAHAKKDKNIGDLFYGTYQRTSGQTLDQQACPEILTVIYEAVSTVYDPSNQDNGGQISIKAEPEQPNFEALFQFPLAIINEGEVYAGSSGGPRKYVDISGDRDGLLIEFSEKTCILGLICSSSFIRSYEMIRHGTSLTLAYRSHDDQREVCVYKSRIAN